MCNQGEAAASTIDYAVVHPSSLRKVTSVSVVSDYPSSPHKPVRARLAMPTVALYRRVQALPEQSLDHHSQVGCARRPQQWPKGAGWSQSFTQQEATNAWKDIIRATAE